MMTFVYENEKLKDSPFWQPPFIPISNLTYLPNTVPWMLYPHFHEAEYEISYIAQGQGVLNLPGQLLPVKAGAVTIVPAQVAHCYLNGEDPNHAMSYYTLRFRTDGAETELLSELTRMGTCTVVDPELIALCAQMFRTISIHLTDGEDRSDPLIQTLGLALLQLTLEALQKSGREVELSCPPYANDILTYLQNHTGEKVSMEDVAGEFHLSQAHIFRVFRQTYHISPINYLIYCRMRQARTLILNYRMSTEEIAGRLAYSNVYHIARIFQRFFGCTPEQYLKEAPEFRAEL